MLGYADLNAADLSDADLRNADLSFAVLTNVNLSGADLDMADLTGTDLSTANLTAIRAINLAGCPEALPEQWECIATQHAGMVLVGPGADFSEANLKHVDFSGMNLTGTTFNGANLDGARAVGITGCPAELGAGRKCVQTVHSGFVIFGAKMDISNTNLNDSNLSYLDLEDADLGGSTMVGTTATHINGCPSALPTEWACKPTRHSENILGGPHAVLNNANLMGVDLSNMNLSGIYLKGATVSYAGFQNTNLSNSKLHDADFRYSDLSGANFFNAILTDANFDWANLTGVNWHVTYCGDVTTSVGNGGTCCGHLAGSTPAAGCD